MSRRCIATSFRSLSNPRLPARSLAFTASRSIPCSNATLQAPLISRSFSVSHTALDNMKCILIKDGKGPIENLYLGEEATPSPKKGEVLVKINTFGLNRMDLLQREGKYALPPQASKTILGVEFAGTVAELGEGAQKYKVGDEVLGLAFGGAYAEYITNPEAMLLPKPKAMSWVDAAAMPENWMTAWQALYLECGMKKGEKVLIHAGASGVGVAAIQLALKVGQASKVFATCGTDDKVAFLKKLVDNDPRLEVINYRTHSFEEVIKGQQEGVDVVVDFVGKNYFNSNLAVMNRDARMVILAFLSGAIVDKANIAQFLAKRLTVKGSTLRSRTVEYQAELLQSFGKYALPLIEDGTMKVELYKVFPWTQVQDGQREMEQNKNHGKIVFEVKE